MPSSFSILLRARGNYINKSSLYLFRSHTENTRLGDYCSKKLHLGHVSLSQNIRLLIWARICWTWLFLSALFLRIFSISLFVSCDACFSIAGCITYDVARLMATGRTALPSGSTRRSRPRGLKVLLLSYLQ